jgi:hypothetical protein
MSGRQRSKTVVKLEERKQALRPKGQAALPGEPDPLYGVVLLKTALELKRRKDGSPQEILRGVLARMRIPESEFRTFLEQREDLRKALGMQEE